MAVVFESISAKAENKIRKKTLQSCDQFYLTIIPIIHNPLIINRPKSSLKGYVGDHRTETDITKTRQQLNELPSYFKLYRLSILRCCTLQVKTRDG